MDVALIGYEEGENLGLRYLSSSLRKAGFKARLFNLMNSIPPMIEELKRERPMIVGFSLIYQSMLPDFSGLAKGLRAERINSHFIMGGHFPSADYRTVLNQVPEMDSVALYEGENTITALASVLAAGGNWREIQGLAYRENGSIKTSGVGTNKNLNALPWPERDPEHFSKKAFRAASILGSRGCPWRCSFCSISRFYKENKTPGRRLRDPKDVVKELKFLWEKYRVRVILWQDDEFLGGGRRAENWLKELAERTISSGLSDIQRWKISCRSDNVFPDMISFLQEAGLAHVYLGVESGDPSSLKHLRKDLTADDHLNAKKVILKAGLTVNMGFMLLEPWSTTQTLRGNLSFLKEFTGDGTTVFPISRMLPYSGTDAEKKLKKEERLRLYKNSIPGYRFTSEVLDTFYNWVLFSFKNHAASPNGLEPLFTKVLFTLGLDLPGSKKKVESHLSAKKILSAYNLSILEIMEEALDYAEKRPGAELFNDTYFAELSKMVTETERKVREKLVEKVLEEYRVKLKALENLNNSAATIKF